MRTGRRRETNVEWFMIPLLAVGMLLLTYVIYTQHQDLLRLNIAADQVVNNENHLRVWREDLKKHDAKVSNLLAEHSFLKNKVESSVALWAGMDDRSLKQVFSINQIMVTVQRKLADAEASLVARCKEDNELQIKVGYLQDTIQRLQLEHDLKLTMLAEERNKRFALVPEVPERVITKPAVPEHWELKNAPKKAGT